MFEKLKGEKIRLKNAGDYPVLTAMV